MISATDEPPVIVDPGRQMLSIEQVAQQLGVSPGCVYNLVQTHKLAAHRIGIRRGRVKIQQAAVDAYLTSTCTIQAGPTVQTTAPTQLQTLRPRKIKGRKKRAG